MSPPRISPSGGPSESSRSNESTPGFHPAREWPEGGAGDDDDEDMDYYPDEDEIDEFEDDELEDDPDGSDGYFAPPGLGFDDINIQFHLDGPDDVLIDDQGPTRASMAQLLNILAPTGLRQILRHHGVHGGPLGDSDEDDDFGIFTFRKRRHGASDEPPKVPSDAGTELMGLGDFGSNLYYADELRKRKNALATKLMWRELGLDTVGGQRPTRSISQDMIPGSITDKIFHYDSRCYSGQFSDDGNFFFCCSQDFKVRMYDTSNPFEWKYYKSVDYPFGRWTITDATLSPDNRFLAYSSIENTICLAATDPADQSDPSMLDLASFRRGRLGRGHYGSTHFGIWSLRFSGDGREIVAGTSDNSVIVYDLESRQSVLRLRNHKDDVNAVCFGDITSPHILYSGSDDTTLRVWDRRSMGDGREAGAFVGHTEGLTYVDSKGDGRYILSNAKDQTMKLWDLRKMMTTEKFDPIERVDYSSGYDYRFDPYPQDYYLAHPDDCSVVTFRGHQILRTLIRCHFSPPGSTNSRYVYTGSADGKVYVYNLDATLAGTIDVKAATVDTRPKPWTGEELFDEVTWRTCVRDASWHPNAPVLAATSWNGWNHQTGTCTLHTWNDSAAEDEGEPPVGKNYDSRLRNIPEYDEFQESIRSMEAAAARSRRVYNPPDPEDMY